MASFKTTTPFHVGEIVFGCLDDIKVIITLSASICMCVAEPGDEMLRHNTFVYYLHGSRPLMRHRRRLIRCFAVVVVDKFQTLNSFCHPSISVPLLFNVSFQ